MPVGHAGLACRKRDHSPQGRRQTSNLHLSAFVAVSQVDPLDGSGRQSACTLLCQGLCA